MKWNSLLSAKRFGQEDQFSSVQQKDIRSQFQRDYDRLIFSSPFRRLQNKTQVFPLPGSIFVHNRLTHSLEVSSVGRSLGNALADKLIQLDLVDESHLIKEIGSIVAGACLAHDLGNPPFGHSGEKALSHFFSDGKGKNLQDRFTQNEWHDLINFEGNANALRLLTHAFHGRRKGGFALTYSSIASIVKYPWESSKIEVVKKKKYGFFQAEKADYLVIAQELGIPELSSGIFARFPLVYLVEAADDICYQIMDIEDAHKLKILSTEETKDLLLSFYHPDKDKTILNRIDETCKEVTDINEQIAYIRAGVIGKLISECVGVFVDHYELIMEGKFQSSLIKEINEISLFAYKKCTQVAVSRIYRHRSVVEIELAGYKILGTLLDEFVTAVLEPENFYSRNLLSLIPEQYNLNGESDYEKIMSVLDFISGMTDVFALDLYRTIKGIELPGIN
ncbi:deoxyguanosinetriphosphate triphosphohydrolase [Labilibaculum sp. A4]|uniref:deoxyguanosinetriphosphate triphosphohydrolase n=1 Tax=Labilibaculum euxinus TaxID=2686357 RepID=UPI000F6243C3|nr:deoxyguanosinetriphosphate triphosphohydrolase [Labilibaculum euxinus]MDQ1770055.1 deoxyguanosinetriphosphate triphosphohydrolase [Labilibaculum euxinus]MWN77476.1 deoxyguanosinetriphosphate triphosphohydrolase [Labilibaculum euxinus]